MRGRDKRSQFIDFLCVGAQKAGTTSLHHMLRKDKRIFLPEEKEVHYFSQYYSKNLKWYKDKFNQALPSQIRGEITPFYLFHEEAPKRIARTLKNIKILVLLRDPAERVISHYKHAIKNGNESLGIVGALLAENQRTKNYKQMIKKRDGYHRAYQQNSYLKRSRYDEQLKRYCKYFKREDICIVKSEDLFKNDRECLETIYGHIGLEIKDNILEIEWYNRGTRSKDYEEEKEDLRVILADTYKYCEEEWGISWRQDDH